LVSLAFSDLRTFCAHRDAGSHVLTFGISNHYKRKDQFATVEKWKERHMNSQLEPLTCTVAAARKISGLSNSSIYGAINKGLVETRVVMGRRLIIFASLKKALGIRPDGAPPATPGLTGGPIKRPPGRRRKPITNQETTP
jgi:hypothetical protein